MFDNQLYTYFNELFRNPLELASAPIGNIRFLNKSLKYSYNDGFLEVMSKLKINLIVSREYEHLLLAFSVVDGKLIQTFYPIAHPSGIAVSNQQLYVASTRNPNRIIEFGRTSGFSERIDDKKNLHKKKYFVPTRIKYFPGSTYFHDLAFIGDQLYANAVGLNSVIPIDLSSPGLPEAEWLPDLTEREIRLLSKGNFMQINSIAAGSSLLDSSFTASANRPGKYRPGHNLFPVDKTGVVFTGKGEVLATGLTRPHSARFFRNELWLNDSGYGSFGNIFSGKYHQALKLKGWTRGLHFSGNYAFVGTSRILPRFEHYAPGVNASESVSSIVIIDMNSMSIVGELNFPNGNQIFGIESTTGEHAFFDSTVFSSENMLKSIFYKFLISK